MAQFARVTALGWRQGDDATAQARVGGSGWYQVGAVVADTTAPILTSPTLVAINSTSLTGGFTSDKAGFSWTVLTPAAQAAPSEAQIRAGQDATGAAAVASSLNTAMVVGVNTRTLSGATAGTPYKQHTISQDTAGTPNVSNIVSSGSETTPTPDTTAPTFAGGTTLNTGTKTDTTVVLTTSAAATDNIAVTGYEWSSDNGATYPFTSLTNSFTFTALTALTSYNFRVRAYDAAGNRSAHLSLTTSTYRAGGTGQFIRDNTGPVDGGQPGILYNDVELPADADKWFSFSVVSSTLNGGTLDIDPQGRFTFTGAASASFTYQLEVDGENFGAPVSVTLYDTTIYRPTGDVTTTGWTSTGANLFSVIDEVTPDDADFITSPGLSASPGPAVLSFTAPLPAGTYTWRVRAQRVGAAGEIRVVLQDGSGTPVGSSAWQTVTDAFALYELPLSTSAPASRAAIEVRE